MQTNIFILLSLPLLTYSLSIPPSIHRHQVPNELKRPLLADRHLNPILPRGASMPTVDNYTGTFLNNLAISEPTRCLSFVGIDEFADTTTLDVAKCAASCNRIKNMWSQQGTSKPCRFFNMYLLYTDGKNSGLQCAMYDRRWDNSYATNNGTFDAWGRVRGQRGEGKKFEALDNYAYYLTADPGPTDCQRDGFTPAPLPAASASSASAQPTSATDAYTVAAGDDGWKISVKLGVALDQLKAANPDVKWDFLTLGQKLNIPAKVVTPTASPTASASAQPSSNGTTYVVVAGDDGWKISVKLGVTLDQLKGANPNVKWDFLTLGQQLAIPAKASSSTSTPTPTPAASPFITIKPLSSTSASVAASASATSNPPSNGSTYSVVAGDDGWKIANKLGITLDQLKAANPNVKWDFLTLGQQLTVPAKAATISPTASPSPTAPAQPSSTGATYTVIAGDDGWKIANKLGVTLDQLKAANPNVKWDFLNIGQQLSVPSTAKSTTTSGPAVLVGGAGIVTAAPKSSTTQPWLVSGAPLIWLTSTTPTVGLNPVVKTPTSSTTAVKAKRTVGSGLFGFLDGQYQYGATGGMPVRANRLGF